MSAPPVQCLWSGEVFAPLGRMLAIAQGAYGEGEIVNLAPVEERSEATHRHEFAFLREAWLQLPESVAGEYPSPEHLRKRALIATGYCTTQDYVCATQAEAARWAVNLRREADEYAVVIVSKSVVRVHRAKSQSRRAMNKVEFQASKTAVLDWISNLIGVPSETLTREVGRAA